LAEAKEISVLPLATVPAERTRVFAVNPFVNLVAPVTVPPVNVPPVLVLKPVTLNVPPVLFVNVAVPAAYVPPVTLISVGRFVYVTADILPVFIFPLLLHLYLVSLM
jgi:hypothetical protein